MDVYVQAQIGPCTEFVMNGKKQEISIVISPLKMSMDDGTIKVNSGCNMWKACQNPGCQYSLVARPDEIKKKAKT